MAWKKVELGEICEFKYGKGLPQHARIPGEYPVFGSNGVVGFHEESLVSAPAIIIGRKGSIGEVHVSKVDCWPIDTTYYIDEFDDRICFEWLVYVLGHNTRLKTMNKAAAVPGLNRNDAYNLQIPLPPLPEQRRLADLLDRADALRRRDEALLEEYEALGRSVFLEMFGDPVRNERGWEVKSLGEITTIKSGQVDPRVTPYSKMIHVGGENIESNTGEFKNLQIAESLGLISGKYLFDQEDVLYSKIRPYLNKVACPNFEGICSADMYPIRPNIEKITRRFLHFLLTSGDFLSYAEKHSGRTNIPKINRKGLQEYTFFLPPLSLQNHFARIIENLESQKEKVRAQRVQSEALFQGLLQRAFRGDI